MTLLLLFGILAVVVLIALLVTKNQRNTPTENTRRSIEDAKTDIKNHTNSNNSSNTIL